MTTIYDRLSAIAESKRNEGYLSAYANDLHVHDRATLERAEPTQRFLWILRENGTALFPIAIGHDSAWATYWFRDSYSIRVKPLCYLIDPSARNPVRAIDYDRAERLAKEPAPDGRRVRVSIDRGAYVEMPDGSRERTLPPY